MSSDLKLLNTNVCKTFCEWLVFGLWSAFVAVLRADWLWAYALLTGIGRRKRKQEASTSTEYFLKVTM